MSTFPNRNVFYQLSFCFPRVKIIVRAEKCDPFYRDHIFSIWNKCAVLLRQTGYRLNCHSPRHAYVWCRNWMI
ncbi:hypothetical protein HMPREF3213_01292 [Heyndrickxia coagulans]|uniref:Uncharacterized protein n=1 Tax=Heyndrickxia coagulans TaxID=1398 RepID=A0A133KUL4_HEYCO|nr:hypothetical protein HMPREF3213_01292 [Heyndrickxia coagulans]